MVIIYSNKHVIRCFIYISCFFNISPIKISYNITRRNYIFSDDFCNGIWKIIVRGKVGNTYHFSSEKYASVKEIVKIICKLKNKKFKNIVKKTSDRLGKDDIYRLGSNKTKKMLSWSPKTSLKKGLEKTIKFYEIHYKLLKRQSLNYKI